MNTRTESIYHNLREELYRQVKLKYEGKFRFTARDDVDEAIKLAMLVEEVGEVAKEVQAICGTTRDKPNRNLLKEELVQVAAICFAWLESPNFYRETVIP